MNPNKASNLTGPQFPLSKSRESNTNCPELPMVWAWSPNSCDRGENWLLQVLFWSLFTVACIHTHTGIQISNYKNTLYFKKHVLKEENQGWRSGLEIKRAGFSSRGPVSNAQDLHDGSKPIVTPVSRDLTPSSGFLCHQTSMWYRYTGRQSCYRHKNKKNNCKEDKYENSHWKRKEPSKWCLTWV